MHLTNNDRLTELFRDSIDYGTYIYARVKNPSIRILQHAVSGGLHGELLSEILKDVGTECEVRGCAKCDKCCHTAVVVNIRKDCVRLCIHC